MIGCFLKGISLENVLFIVRDTIGLKKLRVHLEYCCLPSGKIKMNRSKTGYNILISGVSSH